MVRKPTLIAFGMVSSAIAIGVTAVASNYTPIAGVWTIGRRHHVVPHVFDGLIRVFWFDVSDPAVEVVCHVTPPQVRVEPVFRGGMLSDGATFAGRRMRQSQFPVRVSGRWQVSPFTMQMNPPQPAPWSADHTVQLRFVRFPAWSIVIVLLLYPVYIVIRGPMLQRRWKRRRRCEVCGYDLTALPTPRCPECGAAVDQTAEVHEAGASLNP